MVDKILVIKGMSCASCANNIEKTIGDLEGVLETSINFASEKLTVQFDENKISIADIKNAIAEIGYQAFENESNNTVVLKIEGMT